MAQIWPGRRGPGVRFITAAPSPEWQERKCRHVVVLGSTGSIGRNTLSVIESHPDCFRVEGLACATSVERLLEQALRHRPGALAVLDEASAQKLKALLPGDYRPEILTGPEGYRVLAGLESADTVLSAQSGAAGLAGTLAAVLAGKVVCLANKESLVLAGDLLRRVCAVTGASILPVDSEHFAIFDCLCGRGDDADYLILTASGGAFRGKTKAELEAVTPAQALKHPNWNMGGKITVDSGTLMNKALEVIEACQLYGLPQEKVRVLVHPQSIVHSLVAFRDGSQLAQLGVPDMRLPIGACLLWPRVEFPLVAPLDLAKAGTLTFEEVNDDVFPALTLARRALSERSGMCVVLNGADEEAVGLFLRGKCRFTDITAAVAHAMDEHLGKVRRAGNAGQSGPFSLSGLADHSGSALEEAAWKQLERIRELDAGARSAVRNFVTGEGARTC